MGTEDKSWGGKRPGSGRKKVVPAGASRRLIRCTDQEFADVLALLEEKRKASK